MTSSKNRSTRRVGPLLKHERWGYGHSASISLAGDRGGRFLAQASPLGGSDSGRRDAQIIQGLGAGDLLVFDNQGAAGYPPAPVSLTGGWRCSDEPRHQGNRVAVFGRELGQLRLELQKHAYQQRPPSTERQHLHRRGADRTLFQADSDGRDRLGYVNPYPRRGKDAETGAPTVNYNVYRAQRVPYEMVPDNPAFRDRVRPPDNAAFHVPTKEKWTRLAHPIMEAEIAPRISRRSRPSGGWRRRSRSRRLPFLRD